MYKKNSAWFKKNNAFNRWGFFPLFLWLILYFTYKLIIFQINPKSKDYIHIRLIRLFMISFVLHGGRLYWGKASLAKLFHNFFWKLRPKPQGRPTANCMVRLGLYKKKKKISICTKKNNNNMYNINLHWSLSAFSIKSRNNDDKRLKLYYFQIFIFFLSRTPAEQPGAVNDPTTL